MPAKKITRGDVSTNKLRRGVSEVADTVALTMGPRGQNIIVERAAQPPLVTKDGVTVAREITLEDGVEEMGAMLVIDAATKTADVAGDGTTAACVLSKAIFEAGLKAVDKQSSKIKVAEGIKSGVAFVCNSLQQMSRKVKSIDELIAVASIAANSDAELGKLIGEAMNKTGRDGVVVVQEGPVDGIEFVDGMQVKSGMKHQAFQNTKSPWVFEAHKPIIAIINKMVASAYDIVPLLEYAVFEKRPVVLFAKDMSAEVMQTMIMNKMQGKVGCCAVRIPDYGAFQNDIAEDIATVVGAKVIGDTLEVDLKRLKENNYGKKWSDLVGTCDVIRITKNESMLITNKYTEAQKVSIDNRITQAKIQQSATTNNAEKDKYQRRIASLSGGVGKLMISGITGSELEQKKARVEDALYATKAASEDGILPGGGVALFYASIELEGYIKTHRSEMDTSVVAGLEVIREAIIQPLIHIAKNRDESASPVVIDKLKNWFFSQRNMWFGWDADSDKYGDMHEMKIIDPLRVPITALTNAASVATLLLNTAGVIEYLQPEEAAQIAARGMHHAKVG
jgi:chaperonin GroEL